jgi:hypothetical protein
VAEEDDDRDDDEDGAAAVSVLVGGGGGDAAAAFALWSRLSRMAAQPFATVTSRAALTLRSPATSSKVKPNKPRTEGGAAAGKVDSRTMPGKAAAAAARLLASPPWWWWLPEVEVVVLDVRRE